MSAPGSDPIDDEGFEPVPPDSEPPEGAVELALQEEAAGTEGVSTVEPEPPVLGRSYRLDLERGRLLPEGGQPLPIRGVAAQRQAIEKVLRTPRGAAIVHDDQYGIEGDESEPQGQPFDASAFAELEERTRDALLALPWVLEVEEFEAEGGPDSTVAYVSFRVIPEGDESEPIDVNRYPLPLPA